MAVRTMGLDVGAAVDRLMQSYSGYYDVSPCDEGDLVARAEFHSRGEKYLLVRGVNLWSVEDHEYVYVFAGDRLDEETLEHALQMSIDEGMERINPGPDHHCSLISTIFIYDSIDECIPKRISKYRDHRDFLFMLRGWMDHRVASLETSTGTVMSNRAGREVAANLRAIVENRR